MSFTWVVDYALTDGVLRLRYMQLAGEYCGGLQVTLRHHCPGHDVVRPLSGNGLNHHAVHASPTQQQLYLVPLREGGLSMKKKISTIFETFLRDFAFI